MLMLGQDATVRKSLLGLFGWYIPANPYSLLQPHLPLLLLQTSSALSNIFPEIRLDAAKLVHLLLQHVPSQVTTGWPAASLDGASSSKAALDGASSGESTILEGLRLALGLGGEKATSAQNRMSAGGKLVILKALLAFVTAALRGASKGEDEATATLPRDTFGIWRPSGERESKNRGKERAVVAPDSFEQGWFAGVQDWGVDVETNTSWEVGRLGGSGELGGTEGVVQALSVSRRSAPATTILKLALTHRLSNCTSSSTLSSCPHSSNLRPRHSPSPNPRSPHPPARKRHLLHSAPSVPLSPKS
jgi:pre-rRNA-processing protein IPI1